MELLAPAGSPEALTGRGPGRGGRGVSGVWALNARRNAKNFTREELEAGVGLLPSAGGEGLPHPQHPADQPGAAPGRGDRSLGLGPGD